MCRVKGRQCAQGESDYSLKGVLAEDAVARKIRDGVGEAGEFFRGEGEISSSVIMRSLPSAFDGSLLMSSSADGRDGFPPGRESRGVAMARFRSIDSNNN